MPKITENHKNKKEEQVNENMEGKAGVRGSTCWREGDEWALHKRRSLIFKSSRVIFSSAAPKPEGI